MGQTILVMAHHTKTVMSHSGIFWRQIPATLSGQIHTMLKSIFTVEQNDFGVCFSDMHKKKTPIHKIKPYFMKCVVKFLNHSYLKWSVHLSSVPFFCLEWNLFLKNLSSICKLLPKVVPLPAAAVFRVSKTYNVHSIYQVTHRFCDMYHVN